MNDDLQVLTAEGIHEEYRIPLSFAKRILKTRRIPAFRSGKKLACLRKDVEAWLEKQGEVAE